MIRLVIELGVAAIVALILAKIVLDQAYALRAHKRELGREEATADHDRGEPLDQKKPLQ